MTPVEATAQGSPEEFTDRVLFNYIKSNFFRVVHADGAHGGITPRGLIEINFYSERRPIPKSVVHSHTSSGVLGPEITDERVEREGLVREVDVGVIMGLGTAKSLYTWLADKIQLLEQLQQDKSNE
jgi:hypothetical protein